MGGEWWGESGHLVRSVPLVVSFPPKMMECLLRWPERWAGSDTCTGGLIWMPVGGCCGLRAREGTSGTVLTPPCPWALPHRTRGGKQRKAHVRNGGAARLAATTFRTTLPIRGSPSPLVFGLPPLPFAVGWASAFVPLSRSPLANPSPGGALFLARASSDGKSLA